MKVSLTVDVAQTKGYGAFALEPISKGLLVREYVGELIDEEEKRVRASLGPSKYQMAYGRSKYIDARRVGNVSRYINHSCAPNCRAEEWTVGGVYRIGIVAIKNIKQGEEVTINYSRNFNLLSCACTV